MKCRTRKRLPQYCDTFDSRVIWVGCTASAFLPQTLAEIAEIAANIRNTVAGTRMQGLIVPAVTLGGGWLEVNWELTYFHIPAITGTPYRWHRVTSDMCNKLNWVCRAGRVIDPETNTVATWIPIYD